MAQSNAERLINLGFPAEQAKILQEMVAGGNPYTATMAQDAIKTKAAIAALTPSSTAAEIVAALQA